jgi:sporulation protein YlmC with PRC-barrel domain
MANEDRKYSKQILGKTVVSKAGKKFGEVGNILFEVRTGEILHLTLRNPTTLADNVDLEKDEQGNLLIPHSAVIAIGDYIVVSEEDIL